MWQYFKGSIGTSRSILYIIKCIQCLCYLLYLDQLIYDYQKMRLFQWLSKYIPRPFRYLQRKLDIEKEWADFKTNIQPHKYKITVLFLLLSYPFYSSYLHKFVGLGKQKITNYINKHIQPAEPAFQLTENLIKHLLQHIFLDPKVKEEALSFLFAILKDEKFSASILGLLISALKSQNFLKELKVAVKEILVEQLKEPEVRQSINDFLEQLSKNEKIRNGFIQLIQDVFSSKQSVDTIVNLLKKGITNQQVKTALGQTVGFAVNEVLTDEETISLLKIFILVLLRKIQSDDQIKGMMDLLFSKGLGILKKKKEKDAELDKILKPKKSDHLL